MNATQATTRASEYRRPLGRQTRKIGIAAIAALLVLLAEAIHRASGGTFIGFHWWQLFVIAGILSFSGLVSGLSGFAFSAIGSSCLLLMPPTLAIPLLMALSAANQLMSIGQLRAEMPKRWNEVWPGGYGPYVLGGNSWRAPWDLAPEPLAGDETHVGIWRDPKRLLRVFAFETSGAED
jgi:hypothetical protein